MASMKVEVLIFAQSPTAENPVVIRSGICDGPEIQADLLPGEYERLIDGEDVRINRIVLGVRITGRIVPLMATIRRPVAARVFKPA